MATKMPNYRTDHVGSLIRPKELLDAQEGLDGVNSPGTTVMKTKSPKLVEIEDKTIREVVQLQEDAGVDVVTDGEFRRASYFADFMSRVGGLEITRQTSDFSFVNGTPGTQISVVGKVSPPQGGIMTKDFAYLKSVARKATPKVTIPSPTHAQFFESEERLKNRDAYKAMDAWWDDMIKAYRAELKALAAAGCTYAQYDDTTFVKLCDPKFTDELKRRGIDPAQRFDHWIDVLNRTLEGKPAGMTVAIHQCRGNGPQGAWISQGGYDPVAEKLFSELKFDRFLLEYDSERAGGFAPLRFVPKDKSAVLGLMTTKNAELESADTLKRRIDEASKYIDPDQLALSPQCGFASGRVGGMMTITQEADKLKRIVETAHAVWR
jgi:5-methyltetrahydropteroyltriglutamate--homocysteine methyltransferase